MLRCEKCGCEELEPQFVEKATFQGIIEISFECTECDAEYRAYGVLHEIDKEA